MSEPARDARDEVGFAAGPGSVHLYTSTVSGDAVVEEETAAEDHHVAVTVAARHDEVFTSAVHLDAPQYDHRHDHCGCDEVPRPIQRVLP